jgi:hypothetical protein
MIGGGVFVTVTFAADACVGSCTDAALTMTVGVAGSVAGGV